MKLLDKRIFSVLPLAIYSAFLTATFNNVRTSSPLALIKDIVHNIFQPHVNVFIVGYLNHANANLYFYMLILCLWASIVLYKLHAGDDGRTHAYSKLKKARFCTVCVLTVYVVLQTAGYSGNEYFGNIKKLAGKTLGKKHELMFPDIHRFCVFSHQTLPGVNHGLFMTDLDVEGNPVHMSLHRTFRYHIYPLDIRKNQLSKPEFIVLFYKKDIPPVPTGEYAIYKFDDLNRIMVRKPE